MAFNPADLYRLVGETGPARKKVEEAIEWLLSPISYIDGHPAGQTLLMRAYENAGYSPLTIQVKRIQPQYEASTHTITIHPDNISMIRSAGYIGEDNRRTKDAL